MVRQKKQSQSLGIAFCDWFLEDFLEISNDFYEMARW